MNHFLLNQARTLWDRGLAILWIKEKSKAPVGTGWTTGPRKSWQELEAEYRDGYNVGVRTGTPSYISGKFLACIDVDIKKPEFKEVALARLSDLVGFLKLPEVSSGGGHGSRHLYCLTDRPFKMVTVEKHKDAWEIVVYSDGRQMVLPPSIHPSGRNYRWVHPFGPTIPTMNFEKWMEADGPGQAKVIRSKKDGVAPADFSFKPVKVELDWLPIPAEILAGIKSLTGVTDRSGFLLRAVNSLISAGLSNDEILSVLTDRTNQLAEIGYDHAQTSNRERAAKWIYRYTLHDASQARDAGSVFGGLPLPKPLKEEAADEGDCPDTGTWKQGMDRTRDGYRSTLKNLDLIFRNAVTGNVFVQDLFASRIAYGINPPWNSQKKIGDYLHDVDLVLVKRWLANSEFQMEPGRQVIEEATMVTAHDKAVHPVREYLKGLKWDGVPRINTWLRNYCHARAAEPYLSEVGRKFLLAMVRRVFEPGCQWDYVLILEGNQGVFKSSLARALASDDWFLDNLPDLKDKDAMLNLQGKWLIELGELASIKRSDFNLVKTYLVRRVDTVRPHYGRLSADVKRQSVFIGTVNEGEYLKDPTGNRRYWPVRVGLCDADGIREIRDQLFAEAFHIYQTTGEVLKLSDLAERQARAAQENRRVDDGETEMEEILIEWIKSQASQAFDFDRFTTRDLLYGVGVPWGRYSGTAYVNQMASSVLRRVGFEKAKYGGQRVWKDTLKIIKKIRGKAWGIAGGSALCPKNNEEDFY
jgi:predicted P-loop ATPase